MDRHQAGARVGDEVLARLGRGTPGRPVALGRYDVIGLLGHGGMGTVYEAIDRERGMPVALKTLSAGGASAGAQLKREFRVVADVAHPNLASVYELCCEDGLWFFAMERVDGGHFTSWARGASEAGVRTIRAPVARTMSTTDTTEFDLPAWRPEDQVLLGPITEGRVRPPVRVYETLRHALAELVRGIMALHGAGLRHGDIKPSNVLVRPDGRVVVVDFGLAQPVDEGAHAAYAAGTPLYMAPEQLAGDAPGPEADWYAVGVMLYETLTGRMPFRPTSLLELYFKKCHETPLPPSVVVPGTPEELSQACMALLRPEPERRPNGAALLHMLTGEVPAAPSVGDRGVRLFVGRQRELVFLEHAYGLARAGFASVAHVHGPSGIGKSAMVRSFLRGVRDVDRARVLRGRCYERESVPYKAFDGIVDDLATHLGAMPMAEVEALLPGWIWELCQVFPALSAVPAVARRSLQASPVLEPKELRRRAWAALAELFADLGRQRTVVLSIDDLQWADDDSAALLEALLAGASTARMLVVASFRDDALANQSLASYFARCDELQRRGGLSDVPVAGLEAAEAERLARAVLGTLGGIATEERVHSLVAEAHGVPFFIEELARFTALDSEAHVSLDEAIAARVRALPPDQRALVETAAVADSPVPQSVAFAAAGLDAGALPDLLALRSASLLVWAGAGTDDLVSPYHDRIREAVLAALPSEARQARHLALGRAHATRPGQAPSGAWVFDAVRHLSAARELLTDPGERLLAARLHLEAGRMARRAAAFPLAFLCFEGGIAMLADDAWDAAYDLALGLHGGAAETAYLSAEWTSLDARVAEVKAHGRSVMDQLGAWEVAIDAHIGRHEYPAAVDAASEVLALLGVSLPRDPDEAVVGAAFQRALACLERVGHDGLEALPDVDDPRTAAAMRIQIRVSPAAYFSKPLLLPVLAANLVATSVERGLSNATPYALALFGIVLNTLGMYPVSHGWGELAVRLLDRFEDRSLEAATRHVIHDLVCTWMVPLHTVLAPLREVFDIGRRTGDFEYASYAAHGYVHHALYAARPLGPLLTEALELGEQMRALGQVNAVHVHAPFEQLLKALAGELPGAPCLDDAGFDTTALLAQAASEGSRSGILVLRVVMGLAHFWLGRARDASACFEIARHYTDAAPSVWHVPMLHQFAPLAACLAWDELPEAERATVRREIDGSLAALRALAGHAPVNFAHRVSLVEGAIRRIEGDPSGACACFERAVAEAAEGGWLNDIALGHELAAGCLADPVAAEAARARARDAYAAWGAVAKVRALDTRLPARDA